MVTLRRDILIVVCPFITHCFYCGQDCTQECAQARKMDASPSSPSLGNIPGNYSVTPQVASEEKDKSNKGCGGVELEINLGCH